MKITIFTSNKSRHNYFVNLLSKVADELYVIQECSTIFPGEMDGHYPISDLMKKYFSEVNNAQNKFFLNSYINSYKKNIKTLPMTFGDLNYCPIEYLSDFLNSDFYIVFGSSYIKGELLNFLVNKSAINIHMGVSPYYRGTDCNFWALFDNNPHLVGSTIHLLSKGLDSGPILYHAMSKIKSTPYEYTMSCVKAAFYSIYERILNKQIFKLIPINQDKLSLVRYSKKKDFNEEILEEFFKKKIDLESKKFDKSLLKDPFFYEI